MARTTIADILALLGPPGLDDSAPEGRDRFREFIRQPKWSPDDLGGWIGECLELASRARPEYYLALQDLVVTIGVHLGFEVEFGSYGASGAEIAYDGRWHAICGADILLEVKTSPWPLRAASQLGQYMDEYALATGRGARDVFGIWAVGDGDFAGLVDQIRGSEYRNRIKVASIADLLRLFTLRQMLEAQMPLERVFQVVQDLLLPFDSVNIGGVLDIIEGVAACSGEHPRGLSPVATRTTSSAWCRSELREFLDGRQPYQVAMLLALCSSPRCELTGEEMVDRMRALAPVVPGLDTSQSFSARTISGARSGLSKREQQAGKVSIIECRNGSYTIREDCREWVAEWLRDRGLLPVQMDVFRDQEAYDARSKVRAVG